MNSLEFFLACRWLSERLPGARVQKGVWLAPADGRAVLEFYSKGLGGKRFLAAGKGLLGFVAEKPPAGEKWTAGREFLEGKVVESAGQVGFDRILRIDFAGGDALIAEVFDGNVMLLRDGVIKFCLKSREWSGRRLFAGERYVPPPAGPRKRPDELAEGDLETGGEAIGRFLAVRLGFGPEISESVRGKAGVPAEKTDLDPGEKGRILSAISELFRRPQEADGPPPVAVAPLASEASSGERKAAESEARKRQRIARQIEEMEREAALARKAGELILANLREVDDAISAARAGDLKPRGIVKAARKGEGKIIVELGE